MVAEGESLKLVSVSKEQNVMNLSRKRFSNLIHPAHTVLFHRCYLLTEKDEVEAGQRLDGLMVDDIAVYLLAGCFAQGFVITRHEA